MCQTISQRNFEFDDRVNLLVEKLVTLWQQASYLDWTMRFSHADIRNRSYVTAILLYRVVHANERFISSKHV